MASSDSEDGMEIYNSAGPSTRPRTTQMKGTLKRHRPCDLCRSKKIRCDGAERRSNVCSNCVALGVSCTYVNKAQVRWHRNDHTDSLERRIKAMDKVLQKYTKAVNNETYTNLKSTEYPAAFVKATSSSNSTNTRKVTGTSPFLQRFKDGDGEVTIGRDHFLSKKAAGIEACKPISLLRDYEGSDDDKDKEDEPTLDSDLESNCIVDTDVSRFHGESSNLNLVLNATGIQVDSTTEGERMNTRDPNQGQNEQWVQHLLQIQGAPYPLNFPPEDLAASLIDLYFRYVNNFLPVIHEPTFRFLYNSKCHQEDRCFGVLALLVFAVASRYSHDSRVCLEGAPRSSAGWKYFIQVEPANPWAFLKLPELQSYVLLAFYLHTTSAIHSAWTFVGVAIRRALNIGLHRKKSYKPLSLHHEQWKRTYWCLVMLDTHLSMILGRTPLIHDEDVDTDYPKEIDDEYWVPPNAPENYLSPPARFYPATPDEGEQASSRTTDFVPIQPAGKPSKISFFVCSLKLGYSLAYGLRSLYLPTRLKVWLGVDSLDYEGIIAGIESSLNEWLEIIPPHLRWDPNREDQIFFEQSAVLYAQYHHVRITIHQPFVSITYRKNPFAGSFPSREICCVAARSCCHLVEVYGRRVQYVFPAVLQSAFTNGMILLLMTWDNQRKGQNVSSQWKDIAMCLHFLQSSETEWRFAGRFVDILREFTTSAQEQRKDATASASFIEGKTKALKDHEFELNPVTTSDDAPRTMYRNWDISSSSSSLLTPKSGGSPASSNPANSVLPPYSISAIPHVSSPSSMPLGWTPGIASRTSQQVKYNQTLEDFPGADGFHRAYSGFGVAGLYNVGNDGSIGQEMSSVDAERLLGIIAAEDSMRDGFSFMQSPQEVQQQERTSAPSTSLSDAHSLPPYVPTVRSGTQLPAAQFTFSSPFSRSSLLSPGRATFTSNFPNWSLNLQTPAEIGTGLGETQQSMSNEAQVFDGASSNPVSADLVSFALDAQNYMGGNEVASSSLASRGHNTDWQALWGLWPEEHLQENFVPPTWFP